MRIVQRFFLFVGAICLVTVAFAQSDYRPHMLVKVMPESTARLQALYTFHQLDLIPGETREEPYLLAYPEDLELLQQQGYAYEILYENYEKILSDRLGRRLDDMGGYHTYAEIVAELDSIHAHHPTITTAKFSVGQSIQGRELWCMKISDNPGVDESEPEIFYNSLTHAREPAAMEALLYTMNYLTDNYGDSADATAAVNGCELYFVPCMNPDGYVYNQQTNPNGGGMWRKNRRLNYDGSYGVDLNRNYGWTWGLDNDGSSPIPSSETYRGTAAFSEPETDYIRQFINSRSFVISADYHTYSNLVLKPWGTSYFDGDGLTAHDAIFTMLLDSMAYWIHSVNGVWYSEGTPWQLLDNVNGPSIDWEYGDTLQKGRIFAVCTEVGSASDGFWPPESRILPLARENHAANMFLTRIAASLLPAEFTLSSPSVAPMFGTADSTFTFSIIYTSAGNIAPSVAEIYVDDVLHVLTTTDYNYTDGSLFRYVAGPGLAQGVHEYYFHFVGDTLERRDPTTGAYSGPLVGTPILCYAMETEPGWTVGAPGDNATTGIWGRMNPEGTYDDGRPVQPEDDHTAAPGVICFVTDGRAGSSAGTYDVDGGKTTLLSPIWDLSVYDNALLQLWTWYSNDEGNNPGQDAFVVDVSSNGGTSWVNLLNTTNNWEYWKKSDFFLENYITLTNQVKIRIIAQDQSPGSLVEAAVDDVCLYGAVTAPEAVTDLVIAAEGLDIRLFWRPSPNAESYRIERALEPFGNFAQIGVTADTTFIHAGGAQMDERAFYRVIATN